MKTTKPDSQTVPAWVGDMAFDCDFDDRVLGSLEDKIFVTEYLDTFAENVVTELARQAAVMAPTPGSFDAEKLVAQAIAIRRVALIAPEAKRRELISRGTLVQLGRLENALREQFSGTEAASRIEAVSVARQRAREKRDETNSAGWAIKAEQVVCDVEKESQCARPALPCAFEDAFQWALSAKADIPWTVLEHACADCSNLRSARKCLDYAEKMHLHESAKTALSSGSTSASDPAMHEATLREIVELRSYVKKFKPGTSPPAWMNKLLDEYWKHPVSTPDGLSRIVRSFRAFWQENGASYEEKWRDVKAKRSAGGKMTNSKKNPQYWTDESILQLVQQFAAKHRPAQHTPVNARGFSIPGRDATDAGEILGALIALKEVTTRDAAVATVKQTLSHAKWRAEKETARGSSAGTAARLKSGTFREGLKGITVKDETLLECLNVMGERK